MKSWKRRLRMGMVGGGQGAFIGWVHRYAAALDQQIDLVAGCFSRQFSNTRATGEQLYLQPERCYRSYQEMITGESRRAGSDRIDFVSIVTPNDWHYPIAKAFLEAGFHVVCDKPVTHSLEEAQALAKVVQDTGRVFALTHNYTGNPLVRQIRSMFAEGRFGRVRKVIVEYLQDFLCYPHEKEGHKQALWRVDPRQAGPAGTLGDCGSHAFNLMEYVTLDPVAELCADKTTFLPDRVLDEDAGILLRLRGGGRGLMTVSQIAVGEENNLSIRIYTEQAGIRWYQENPNYLQIDWYGRPRETWTRGSKYLASAAKDASRVPVGHPEGYLEDFANIYCGVAQAIRAHIDGQPLGIEQYCFPTVLDGLREMQFIDKALESAANGSTWVRL